jgi:hypothetical protein
LSACKPSPRPNVWGGDQGGRYPEAAREEASTLGAKIAGFDVPENMALGEGGYAGFIVRGMA